MTKTKKLFRLNPTAEVYNEKYGVWVDVPRFGRDGIYRHATCLKQALSYFRRTIAQGMGSRITDIVIYSGVEETVK